MHPGKACSAPTYSTNGFSGARAGRMVVWSFSTTKAAVRVVALDFEISEEKRPKRVSARIHQGRRNTFSEYAIALVLDLDDPVLNPYQLAVPRGSPVCQISLSQTTPKGIRKTPYCRTKPLTSRMVGYTGGIQKRRSGRSVVMSSNRIPGQSAGLPDGRRLSERSYRGLNSIETRRISLANGPVPRV
jgi:hypothetical protein